MARPLVVGGRNWRKRVVSQVLWTPLNDASAVFFIDVNDSSTLTFTSGAKTAVSAIASKVGSLVLNAGGQPGYQSLNGGYALAGNVNYRYLKTATGLSVLPQGNAASMMMFVGVGATSYNPSFAATASNSGDRGIGTVNANAVGCPATGADLATTVTYGTNGNIVVATWNGASPTGQAIRVDGTQAVSTTRSGAIASAPTTLQILSNNTGSADLIQAGVIRTSMPSTALMQKYEGWAAWRCNLVGNLPAAHPYKSRAPYVSDP